MRRAWLYPLWFLLLTQSLVARAQDGGPGALGSLGGGPRLSSIVDKILGEGELAPWARLVFHLGENGELCATVGAKRGPAAANSRVFIVAQLVDGKPQQLDFSFPSKPARKDADFIVWETCLDGPGLSTDNLQVTMRNLGKLDVQGAEKMPVVYPQTKLSSVLNISKTSSGNFEWSAAIRDYSETEDVLH